MFESSDIRAVIFDLDGTLLETEHLKAEAYADLVGELTGRGSPEPSAIELYRSIVGATDLTVCEAMNEKFDLEPLLGDKGWPGERAVEVLHRLRMQVYVARYGTPAKLRSLVYPHNVSLAKTAAGEGLPIGVATMSFSSEAERVLEAIGLTETVETIVGVDHVKNPKPAPDAFLLAMEKLGVSAEQTLVIEDSPRGTQAAEASGALWICVSTDFSRQALSQDDRLEAEWIVHDPATLGETVARRIAN